MKKFCMTVVAFLMLGAGAAFAIPEDPDNGNSERACDSNSPIVQEYCGE